MQLLRERYVRDASLLHSEPYPHDSLVWRTVCEGLGVIREGSSVRIGSGKELSFWEGNWLQGKCVKDCRGIIVAAEENGLKVCDVVVNGRWNIDSLQSTIPADVRENILSIPVSIDANSHDKVFWKHTHTALSLLNLRMPCLPCQNCMMGWTGDGCGAAKRQKK